jgi:spermidine synthase
MPSNSPNCEATRYGFAMPILTGMVFLGATLLFGMEPLVGRILVPYFGGAAHVWLISLMFFQAMLLVGYLYAHLFARLLGRWHLLLLLLPLINLPIGATLKSAPEAPLLALLAVLLVHFALPFIVLSTTAVVAQSWLARSIAGQSHEPYPLYAASNAGSLLALFGYAFLVEPLLGVKAQSFTWTTGYIIYAIMAVAAWVTLKPGKGAILFEPKKDSDLQPEAAITAKNYALWLLLSALPSAFLLTVTNFIALEVGSFPMVWVIPLALYLSSFVVTFRGNGGVPRFLAASWPEVVILGFLLYLLPLVWVGLIGPLLLLLAVCLVAHGKLYERRPQVRFLTNYYLTMAVGGFLGGAVISLGAPWVFRGIYEYPVILAALGLVFWWCCPTSFPSCLHGPSILRWLRVMGAGILLGSIGICLIFQIPLFSAIKFRHRNFYGTYYIKDEPPSVYASAGFRKLVHGKTQHGSQFLDQEQQATPTSYYYSGGAIAEAYNTVPSPRLIAILGLGAGVLSAYTRIGDVLTYYEIDPDNEKIARTWFTYLDDAKARVSVVPGDGRLSMQEAGKKDVFYDIIIIDAFTGDGIPTHLLTREAMEDYLSHLTRNGIILFHISNRYYDLRSVIKSTSAQLKLLGAMNIRLPQTLLPPYAMSSQCVVLARNLERLKPLLARGWIAFGEGDGLEGAAPWTDDYINLLAPLWARLWPNSTNLDESMHTAARLDTAR